MPIAFLAALVGSLAIHAAALFGTDLDLSGPAEPLEIKAELRPLPAAALPEAPAARPAKPVRKAKPQPLPVASPSNESTPAVHNNDEPEIAVADVSTVKEAAAPAKPVLPAKGVVRYAVYKSSLNMQIGRAEQRWEFAEDGSYLLQAMTETSGLASLLKPMRIEQESRGHMVAAGLQPEFFKTLRNGVDNKESAEFDWSTGQVHLSRDASVQSVTPGTQDILSLNYQLAYYGRLAEGTTLGVVTGKKYDRYALDSLGEEEIEVPAGRFRTLHLRAQTETTTEIWIAIEQRGLPVKIRFTDKKGESFEQVATEIGM